MKLLNLVLLLFTTSYAFSAVNVTKQADHTSYDVLIDDLEMNSTQNGLNIELKGVDEYKGILYKKGYPAIPTVRFYVEAESKKDVQIRVNTLSSTSQTIASQIAPLQESASKLPGSKAVFSKSLKAYAKDNLYPETLYTIEQVGTKTGQKEFLVTLFPIQYNPVNSQLTFTNEFQVTAKKIVSNDKKFLAQKTFAFIIGEKFKESPSISRYKEFKEAQGFFVEEIHVTDEMKAKDVRSKLQEVYNNGNFQLKYALIFGRNSDVPGKESRRITGVTDHYFRAIDTNNYESDINGPDIGVGRVTIRTEKELETIIDKFIRYQEGVFTSNLWLNKIAWLATDDRWEVAEGTHNYVIKKYTAPASFTGVFPAEDNLGGDKLYSITHKAKHQDIIDAVNDGRTIVNYSGHGGTTNWDAPRFNQKDVRSITASSALPFVVSNACITGQFTVKESFGETWLKAPNGAIAFWGSMDNTYWDEDDILEKAMYDGIFTDKKETFSEITQHALREHWKHYGGNGRSEYYWETYVIFGDPSIKLKL